jgi:hypothetical protein
MIPKNKPSEATSRLPGAVRPRRALVCLIMIVAVSIFVRSNPHPLTKFLVGIAFIAALYAIGIHYRLVEIWRARDSERRYNRDHALNGSGKDKKHQPYIDPDF